MRKLMWFAVGFGLSALIGAYFLSTNTFLFAAGISAAVVVGFLLAIIRFPKQRIGLTIMIGCVVGFLWLSLYDGLYLRIPRAADGKTLTMTIATTDNVRQTDYGIAVEGVGSLNGKVYKIKAYLPEKTDLSLGDTITADFYVRSTLPEGAAESTYNTSDGIFLTASAKSAVQVCHAEKLPWYCYPAYVRTQVKETLIQTLPEDVAGFAIALLIGDKEELDQGVYDDFKISGISHVVAVSGLHVTILFSLIYMLVGRKRILAFGVGMPILFFFAAIAGFSPSIIRACIMHGLVIVALLLEKEYDSPTALAFAVLVMVAVNPWVVTGVGFQLSISCMVGILLFAEPIREYLMNKKRLGRLEKQKKLANFVSSSVGMSVGASVFVTPLCAYYFGTVSLVGILTNLLTLWIITVVFYGVVSVFFVGLLWTELAVVIGWLIAWPIRYILTVAHWLASFPLAAIYTDSVYVVFWLIFVYVLLAIYLIMSEKKPLKMICYGMAVLCVVLGLSWSETWLNECRVTVLDVGQGQCVILQSEGRTFVVDCGGDSSQNAGNSAAYQLRSCGIFKIDGLILTHYDKDHAFGAPYLLDSVPADMLYLPTRSENAEMATTLSSLYDNTMVENIMTISYGHTKITLIPSENMDSDNESGLCVLFQTENCDILITGDRSIEGELELMQAVDLPQLEVLVVGHHGSKNSTSQALLDKTKPALAIISVGADNTYGHPSEETLQRLEKVGCAVVRTDREGTVIYKGESIWQKICNKIRCNS